MVAAGAKAVSQIAANPVAGVLNVAGGLVVGAMPTEVQGYARAGQAIGGGIGFAVGGPLGGLIGGNLGAIAGAAVGGVVTGAGGPTPADAGPQAAGAGDGGERIARR